MLLFLFALFQVAGNLLRDSSECDSLADQILNTVFSRYVGANDIANASDANEVRLQMMREKFLFYILYVRCFASELFPRAMKNQSRLWLLRFIIFESCTNLSPFLFTGPDVVDLQSRERSFCHTECHRRADRVAAMWF